MRTKLSDQPISGSRFEKKAIVLLNTAKGSVNISSSIMTCRRSVASRSNCGVCGRSLGWDCGFEPRQWHRWLSLVNVVCCQVEVHASGWLLLQGSPTECGVPEWDRDLLIKRRPWPIRDCWDLEEKQHLATACVSDIQSLLILKKLVNIVTTGICALNTASIPHEHTALLN
jgi:hypothetical protein